MTGNRNSTTRAWAVLLLAGTLSAAAAVAAQEHEHERGENGGQGSSVEDLRPVDHVSLRFTPRKRSHAYIAMPAAEKRIAASANGGNPVNPMRMPRYVEPQIT